MSINDTLAWYDSLKQGVGYKTEKNKNAFAILLNTLMMEQNINKTEFARRAGKSPPYITKVLRGDANLTIASMTELLDAIDCELHINGCHKDREIKWMSYIVGGQTVALDKRGEELSAIWAKQASHGKQAA